jgi:MATE family multidrug resistance protein
VTAEGSRAFSVTHRGVLAIALPMTLAYLTTPLVGIVSLGVVGQLGDPALVGGVAIGGLIFDVAFATFNFLRSGTTGLAAQALGARDREEIVAIFWRALLLALAIGAIVLALQAPILGLALKLIGGSGAVQAATRTYWQIRVLAAPLALANYVILGWLIGLGRAGYGLLLQLVLNGLNIAVSVVLVDRLHFGVAGVGWASVAAESVAALIGLGLVVWLNRDDPRPSLARIVEGHAFRRMIAVNRDIMIRSFALLFAFAFFTARSADAGDVVLAANEILINLTIVAAYFLDGLAAAAEQFAGRAIGARQRATFDRAMRLTIVWGYGVAAAASLFLWLAGPLLIDLMTTSASVRATAGDFLLLAALVPLVGTLAYQMDGIFIGATWSSDMRNMMLLSLAVYFAVWWALSGPLGVTGLWLALLTFLGLRGLTLLWRSRTRVGLAFPVTP